MAASARASQASATASLSRKKRRSVADEMDMSSATCRKRTPPQLTCSARAMAASTISSLVTGASVDFSVMLQLPH